MSETPRMWSSWPRTPDGNRSSPATTSAPPLPHLPDVVPAAPVTNAPVIPINLIDAPSQRMYTLGVYGLLLVWRLYDWWKLVEDDTSSFSLFLKWSFIDLMFMFGVPLLRIPWLEWSESTSLISCCLHVMLNGMLMFRIPLPLEGTLLLFVKTVFDREMSISENSVRASSILHNSSLIMGKQIINILPEGSVTMNPNHTAFCINNDKPTVSIPLFFNQTKPRHVELLRIDFDTDMNETIVLSQKEVNSARKTQDDMLYSIHWATKKPGLYRLHKVVDKTRLEVQRRMSDTYVVKCPKAVIKARSADKCLGDLSDVTMEIEGTPPLKVVYSRTANSDKSLHRFQNIQPENFVSPFLGGATTSTVALPGNQDVSWARTHRIDVPLNESMAPGGKWSYSINEVHDAIGNVEYLMNEIEDGERLVAKGAHSQQAFTVHERPIGRLRGCDPSNPLMVAHGNSIQLPVEYSMPGRAPDDTSHSLIWKFSPLESLTKNGDHGAEAVIEEFPAKSAHNAPFVRQPGLYTLVGIQSKFCDGEIKEPSTCLLLNPPEPSLTISSQNINDKCAGSSIGLLVDLDLIGTPPFTVRYSIITKLGTRTESVKVNGLRHQIELKPTNAGHFKYQFTSIDDAVYKGQKLGGNDLMLEQDVKPPASAQLRAPAVTIDGCIDEPVWMNVELSGEQPFTLEYELVHDGKRTKSKIADITTNMYKINTDPLAKGGEYSLALTSVQDKTGCKIFLNSEAKFTVRRQRPRVSFGQLEGKRVTKEVEGRKITLPLRLTGRPPFSVKYRNLADASERVSEMTAHNTNDKLTVTQRGIYQILEIADDQCPGTVESKASTFEVEWFLRPQIKVADTAVLVPVGDRYRKREVCEGDVDSVEINLFGSPPYNVKYRTSHKPEHGSTSISEKELEVGLGVTTVSMDTSKAGSYEYKFFELSDALYDHDAKKFSPLFVNQKVNRKPAANFVKPGQSYKYCKEGLAGDETIPIKLEGVPPFQLEVDIKHQSSARPETVKIANIETNHYEFRIPKTMLTLGIHQVSVRKVRDFNGCQQKTEYGAPHVQVHVYDVPTIYPLDSRVDYCVGDRISYTLSGTAPFEIFYNFEGAERKAKSTSTTFRRIAEKPGTFTITGISDKASECKARTNISKLIHPMPSVSISQGKQVEVDIHEGGEAEIVFDLWGTPPFEFTYTRSTNARRGQKSQILETRHEVSHEFKKTIRSSQEGTYEVVAIKDAYCSFSTQKAEGNKQRLLQF